MIICWMLGCAPQSPDAWPDAPSDDTERDEEVDEGASLAPTEATARRPGPRPRAPAQDSGLPADTGLEDVPPLAARVSVDVDEGEFPLVVTFDASDSDLGTGLVRYEWDFDDGTEVAGDAVRQHTYVGRGEFDVQLVIVDEATGEESVAEIEIEVEEPDCPSEESPDEWGELDGMDDASGVAASHRAPGLYWVVQDNEDELVVLDDSGEPVAEHDLPREEDLEDLAIVVDPQTGIPMMFIADIGDNDRVRDEIEVWVVEEPDPRIDSDIEPLKMELEYPDGPHDAETLLVDTYTLDLFIVTKSAPDEQSVYVKRAPHDDEGPFELDALGEFDELDLHATGGAVSADGSRIIVRDYNATARLFFRDGYEPFEEALERDPCRIELADVSRGEGVTFTLDGRGIVTVNEGDGVLSYVEF